MLNILIKFFKFLLCEAVGGSFLNVALEFFIDWQREDCYYHRDFSQKEYYILCGIIVLVGLFFIIRGFLFW